MSLLALKENRPLDASYCITAEVQPGGALGDVAGKLAKLEAVSTNPVAMNLAEGLRRRPVRTVLLAQDGVSDWLRGLAAKSGCRIECVKRLTDALAQMTGRLGHVLALLEGLASRGLSEFVHFLPERVQRGDVEAMLAFCLPPQVVDEQAWEDAQRMRQERPRGDAGPLDADYVLSTSEEMHCDGDRGVSRQPFDRVFGPPARGHFLLRGEPGEGKTTALWLRVASHCRQLAADLRAGRLGTDHEHCKVPLVLLLNEVPADQDRNSLDWCSLAGNRTLFRAFGSTVPKEIRTWLDGKVERYEFVLYLDALDELAQNAHHALGVALSELTQAPVLLTSRLTEPNARALLINPRRYRLACLDEPQVQDYLQRYFAGHPRRAELVRELRERLRQSPGPRHLVQLPLLLGLLCQHREFAGPEEPLPTTRTELLRLGLHGLMERGDRERRRQPPRPARNEAKEAILRVVAWQFYQGRPLLMEEPRLLRVLREELAHFEPGDRPATTDTLLREFLEDGVLVRRGRSSYGFVLRSFHEYCLAGWIACESPAALISGDQEAFIRMVRGRTADWGRSDWEDIKPLNQPGWENVWPLVAGQMDRRIAWLMEALAREHEQAEDFLVSRARLGANVLPEARWCPSALPAILGRLRAALVEILRNPEAAVGVRRQCALVLGRLGDEAGRAALVEILRNPETPALVLNACAFTLGRIGDEAARAALVGIFSNPEGSAYVRVFCAGPLGRLVGDEAARAALIGILRNPNADRWVRSACAEALGTNGDETVVPALVEILSDLEAPAVVHMFCAEALGRIGDEAAVPALVEILRNPEVFLDLHRRCAEALGKIGTEAARVALFDILHNPGDMGVRVACAEALGRIGDEAAVPALVEILRNPETADGVRRGCAEALGSLGDEAGRATLVEILRNPETAERVLRACALALGRIGDEAAVPALVEILRNPETAEWVRVACAEALGGIGDEAARAALVEILRNPETAERVLRACAEALGRIGDEAAVPALVEILRNPETAEWVRVACAEALGRIGDEAAVPALVEILRNPQADDGVRRGCAEALGSLGDEAGRATLVEILRNPEAAVGVRGACAEALERIRTNQGWRPLREGGWDAP